MEVSKVGSVNVGPSHSTWNLQPAMIINICSNRINMMEVKQLDHLNCLYTSTFKSQATEYYIPVVVVY